MTLTLFSMSLFGAADGWGRGCKKGLAALKFVTQSTMMNLGSVIFFLKKTQKI